MTCARVLVAGCLATVMGSSTAFAQWGRLDFGSPPPFTMQTASGPAVVDVIGSPGPCARGTYWNFTRVASGGNNGGHENRGFVRVTWCNYGVSQSGDRAELAGFGVSGRSLRPPSGWPDTFFGRFRIFIEQPIRIASGGDNERQLKFFIWHTSVFDGDQRVIGFLENGANCGESDTNAVCFTLQRNINHWTDSATVSLPVGQWAHIQYSWRHGPRGTSFVKIWRNNNDQSQPTAQDLDLSSSPPRPGGTTWVKNDAGYDEGFSIGNAANTGTRFGQDFVYRLMDLELDGSFNSTWATGVVMGPATPTNLRIISQ